MTRTSAGCVITGYSIEPARDLASVTGALAFGAGSGEARVVSRTLTLLSRTAPELSAEWLEAQLPPGSAARAIPPFPGYMLHDAVKKSSISVKDVSTNLAWHVRRVRDATMEPPAALVEQLEACHFAIELDLVKDPEDLHWEHPLVASLAGALQAFIVAGGCVYDANLVDLSGSATVRSSGAPPYDPDGTIDYRAFRCDDHGWSGRVQVPWLGREIVAFVPAPVDPIPVAYRAALERAVGWPATTGERFARYVFDNFARLAYEDVVPSPREPAGIWPLVREFSLRIDQASCFVRPESGSLLTYLSFECTWDEEHGCEVLFDDAGKPIGIGRQGESEPS